MRHPFWLAAVVPAAVMLTTGAAHAPLSPPSPWLMFHHDGRHTGNAPGTGTIPHDGPPTVRWKYPLFGPISDAEAQAVRWTATFPLGDLDGDGSLETVVTSPDNVPGLDPKVVVLKDDPGSLDGVSVLWEKPIPVTLSGSTSGIDQYGAALADADGDGRLDVIFTAADGVVRALDGDNDGALLWRYPTGHFIEGGPMLADLNGDGTTEVIVTTDCLISASCPAGSDPFTAQGGLFVFAADPVGGGKTNEPLWTRMFGAKIDSGPPAIADLDPTDGRRLRQLVFGGWDGLLHVVWRDTGKTVVRTAPVLALDPSLPADTDAVVRTAPLIADFGSGPFTTVFGWMPDYTKDEDARLSAIDLRVRTARRNVRFTPRWTPPAKEGATWKSSPTLVPALPGSPGEDQPLSVQGYGIDPVPGPFVTCGASVFGGVIAVRPDGTTKWDYPMPSGYGSVRASAAVGDVDGDGRPDVIIPAGCKGALYAFDGQSGDLEWSFDLGPYTIPAPSIGDLDGDGSVEIVNGSYDGFVYALGGA